MTWWTQWLPATAPYVACREEHRTEDEAAEHVLRLERVGVRAVYFEDSMLTQDVPEASRTGARNDAGLPRVSVDVHDATRPGEPQPCDSTMGVL